MSSVSDCGYLWTDLLKQALTSCRRYCRIILTFSGSFLIEYVCHSATLGEIQKGWATFYPFGWTVDDYYTICFNTNMQEFIRDGSVFVYRTLGSVPLIRPHHSDLHTCTLLNKTIYGWSPSSCAIGGTGQSRMLHQETHSSDISLPPKSRAATLTKCSISANRCHSCQRRRSIAHQAILNHPCCHRVRRPNDPRWMEIPLVAQRQVSCSQLHTRNLQGCICVSTRSAWKHRPSNSILALTGSTDLSSQAGQESLL